MKITYVASRDQINRSDLFILAKTKVIFRMEKQCETDSYNELYSELSFGHATADAESNVTLSFRGRRRIGLCIGYYQF